MVWIVFLALAAGLAFRPRHTVIFLAVCVLIVTIPAAMLIFWGGIVWALWDYFGNGVWHVTLESFGIWGWVNVGFGITNSTLRWVVRSQRKQLRHQTEDEPKARAKRALSSLKREVCDA
jgi:hypothetical protein